MGFDFCKYHGAGNDFVLVWDPKRAQDRSANFVKQVCDRRRGVGADGLFYLSGGGDEADLTMDFYNCDGSRAEMCGNGLRCVALFAHRELGMARKLRVKTDAGVLQTEVVAPGRARIEIGVAGDFRQVEVLGSVWLFGNTGVPHAVRVAAAMVDDEEFAALSPLVRRHEAFGPAGTNVDYVALPERPGGEFRIRTFERGVEGETLACGTAVAASAVALRRFHGQEREKLSFRTAGGDLIDIDFPAGDIIVKKVFLTGPALKAFAGRLELETD